MMPTRDALSSMQIAAVYNRCVGSNISHRDVEDWGIIEEAAILIALEMWE